MDLKYLYLSFTITVIGLLLLAYCSETLSPPVSKIKDIDSSCLGKNLHVKGIVVEKHRFQGGSLSLQLRDETGSLKIFVPYHVAQDLNHSLVNKSVDLIGAIELYHGELEMIPSDANSIKIEDD